MYEDRQEGETGYLAQRPLCLSATVVYLAKGKETGLWL